MLLTLIDITGILIIYQSLVFLVSTLLNKNDKPFFTKILMGIWLTLIFHFSSMLLGNHGIVDQWLLGPFFGFIYGPLYYIYTKGLTIETTDPKKLIVHFIPAAIVLCVALIAGTEVNNYINTIGLLVSCHFIGYLIITLRLISSYRKELYNTSSSIHNISLYWLQWIIYLQLVILGISLLESYFQTIQNTNPFILVIYFFTLILIHSFYYLGLNQVRLFKGLKEVDNNPSIIKGYTIPEDQFNGYFRQLTRYMEEEKPYLEYDVSLQDISERLSISTRNLSLVINKGFNNNYYAFINQYRLERARHELINSDKPVKEIMYDSGFSNKATFYSSFKKDTGLTPHQYRQNRKKGS